MFFYLPASLKNILVDAIQSEELDKGIRLSSHIDKFYHLLHTLYVKKHIDKVSAPEAFHNLHSDNLRAIYGDHYAKCIIQILSELNIIECDNKYITSAKSKGYRLTEKYRNDTFFRHPATDSAFTKKLDRYYQNSAYERAKQDKKLYARLQMDLSTLTIEYNAAINYCVRQVCQHYNVPIPSYKSIEDAQTSVDQLIKQTSLFQQEEVFRAKENAILEKVPEYKTRQVEGFHYLKFQSYLINIQLVEDKQKIFTLDPDTNRVYTVFTSFPSALRPFLRLNDKPLVYADIRNSQPLLFACMLISYYKQRHLELPADVEDYIQLCRTGQFYNYLMDLEGISQDQRKQFKARFFEKVFFCKTSVKKQWAQQKAMQQHFSNVYAVIVEMKEHDYTLLAKQLQRKESQLFINTITKNLYKKSTDIQLLTCHDALYTTVEYIDAVINEIEYVYNKMFGIIPSIEKGTYENFQFNQYEDANDARTNNETSTQVQENTIASFEEIVREQPSNPQHEGNQLYSSDNWSSNLDEPPNRHGTDLSQFQFHDAKVQTG